MARLKTLKLPKGVEIDEVSNDNLFTHPSAGSVPTTLAVKDYLHDEINKHDQAFWPDGLHRNAIINGNFDIWQRGTSFTLETITAYHADMWLSHSSAGSSVTITREPFTPGQTEVPHNPGYYLNMNITAMGTLVTLDTRVEDVRTFAGQVVTLSFYAKSSVPRSGSIYIFQNFGTGGSSQVTTLIGAQTFSETWQRHVVTFAVPSISGNTVGGGSYLGLRIYHGRKVSNISFAQVQLNIGDKPLPFAPRSYAEELALCQRYCRVIETMGINYERISNGQAVSATSARLIKDLGAPMRVAPTLTPLTAANTFALYSAGSLIPVTAGPVNAGSTPNVLSLKVDVASGLTAGNALFLTANGTAIAKILLGAEL